MRLQYGAKPKVTFEGMAELSRSRRPNSSITAITRSSRVGKCRNTTPCDMRIDLATSAVVVFTIPLRANSAMAALTKRSRVTTFCSLPSRCLHCSPIDLLSIYSLSIYSVNGCRVKRLNHDGVQMKAWNTIRQCDSDAGNPHDATISSDRTLQHGMLDVGDGNRVYWETCGNPRGKPAVVLHGGPGSGCTPWHRRLFDPSAYRIVLFDQRNCGRSTPHASAPDTDLASNNTANLVADIERLREHLGIERWLVLGGSWGSTLALAYAERYPDRVTEIVLFGVTTGRRKEFDWLFRGGVSDPVPRGMGSSARGSPGRAARWRYHRGILRAAQRSRRIDSRSSRAGVVYVGVRDAGMAACAWPIAAVQRSCIHAMAFARIVTHYVRHYAWLEDGSLLRDAAAIADIPGIMVNGRFDLQAPIGWAYDLKRAWPRAKLVIVDNAGHDASNASITGELIGATNDLAGKP